MLVLKTPHQAYLNKQQRQILNKNSVKWLNKKNTWPEKINYSLGIHSTFIYGSIVVEIVKCSAFLHIVFLSLDLLATFHLVNLQNNSTDLVRVWALIRKWLHVFSTGTVIDNSLPSKKQWFLSLCSCGNDCEYHIKLFRYLRFGISSWFLECAFLWL